MKTTKKITIGNEDRPSLFKPFHLCPINSFFRFADANARQDKAIKTGQYEYQFVGSTQPYGISEAIGKGIMYTMVYILNEND